MSPPSTITCIGAVLWDVIGRADGALARGDDCPGRVARTPGGVALNIASALARRGLQPALLGAVGSDADGADLAAACAAMGIDARGLTRVPGATDRYLAIEDAGGLVAAIADARALDGAGALVLAPLGTVDVVVADANLAPHVLAALAAHPGLTRLILVAASPAKALRLAPHLTDPRMTLFLNRAEAGAILGHLPPDAASAVAALLGRGARRIYVTDGAQGAALGRAGAPVLARPAPPVRALRVTGAGDAFLAAALAAELGGADDAATLDAALTAAAHHVAGDDAP